MLNMYLFVTLLLLCGCGRITSPGCGFPDSAEQIGVVAVLHTSIAKA